MLATLFAGAALVEGVQLSREATPPFGRRPKASVAGVRLTPPTAPYVPAESPAPVLRYLTLSPADAYLKNAAIPESRIVDPPARPFYLPAPVPAEVGLSSHCLAQAVYYEAASESLEGQRAVAQVVLNRVRDRRFPKTVCEVVFQGSGLRTGCQFSFTCDGSLDRPPAAAAWLRAQAVADAALGGAVMKAIGHATHYHTVWVTPYWSAGLTKWGRLGAHIFYRWAGGGTPVDIGLRPGDRAAPRLSDMAPMARAEPGQAAMPAVMLTEPVPAPLRPSSSLAASAPPAIWPPPLKPAAGLAAPVGPLSVADAPYQAVRPRGGLDGPHFAARDHR